MGFGVTNPYEKAIIINNIRYCTTLVLNRALYSNYLALSIGPVLGNALFPHWSARGAALREQAAQRRERKAEAAVGRGPPCKHPQATKTRIRYPNRQSIGNQ